MSLIVEDLILGRSGGTRLLGPASLRLERGERLGLTGTSGCGKSLLARSIFGVLPPGVVKLQGKIEAFGIVLDPPSPGTKGIMGPRLAWVPQDPLQALNPFLSVRDQVCLLPMALLGESRKGCMARLAPLLEELRLPTDKEFLGRNPNEISGGQRQRVLLAQALSCQPELLILDEPTTALDPTVQADLLELITRLGRERDLGYLWISHDLGVLSAVTDRILRMHEGMILEDPRP